MVSQIQSDVKEIASLKAELTELVTNLKEQVSKEVDSKWNTNRSFLERLRDRIIDLESVWKPTIGGRCSVVLGEYRDRISRKTVYTNNTRDVGVANKWTLQDFLKLPDVKDPSSRRYIGYNGKMISGSDLSEKLKSRCLDLGGTGEIWVGKNIGGYYFLDEQNGLTRVRGERLNS